MTTDNVTLSAKMAIKPRLVIEVNPALNLALGAKAAEQSMNDKRRVTIKDIVLGALKDKYPDLAVFIDNEGNKTLSETLADIARAQDNKRPRT